MKFQSREQAGKQLAAKMKSFENIDLVYGIAKGGVIVAQHVAEILSCRLVPVHVAKLPLPWNRDVVFGSVIQDGEVYLDEGIYRQMGLSYMDAQKIARTKLAEIKRSHQNIIDENQQQPSAKNREVAIVDEGMATGFTMLGAVFWLAAQGARKIHVATPVASQASIELIKSRIDSLDCLFMSTNKVFSISTYYSDFPAVGDREVREAIKQNRDFLKEFRSEQP